MTDEATPATNDDARRSRRQLLTLAGAAAVGGTALALGQASPAGAANGDNFKIGNTNNAATVDTLLTTEGALSAGLGVVNTGAGVNGHGFSSAGGDDSVDVKLNGSGRLAQVPALDGNAQPTFNIFNLTASGTVQGHEIVRSSNGVIWASTGTGTGGSTQWKRINSPRVDDPAGNGNPFTPFRLLDTRPSESSALTRNTPLSTNTNFPMDIDNLAQIPSGAVGVFGNLTVLASNYSGYVTLFPTGASVPTVANINFGTGALVGNFFQAGLSSTGSLTVRPGDAAGKTVHVIIDIFGYIQ